MKMKKLNSKVCLRVLFHVTFKNVQRALDLIEVHCTLGLKKNKQKIKTRCLYSIHTLETNVKGIGILQLLLCNQTNPRLLKVQE